MGSLEVQIMSLTRFHSMVLPACAFMFSCTKPSPRDLLKQSAGADLWDIFGEVDGDGGSGKSRGWADMQRI